MSSLTYLQAGGNGLSVGENLCEVARSEHVAQRGLSEQPGAVVSVLDVRH